MEQPSSDPGPGRPVRKRRVFFLAGFDPRGPQHYHTVYREEAGLQSQTQQSDDGTHYAVSDAVPDGPYCVSWTVQARAPGSQVSTRYSYLCWDDIARACVPRGPMAWLRAVFGFWGQHLVHGGHAASWRLARRWAWALLSIPIFLAGVLMAMLAAAGVGYGLLSVISAPPGSRLAVSALSALAPGWLGWRLALRWNQVWLTHALQGSYAWTSGRMPALDQRLPGFSRRIFEALQASGDDADDEVLVVGHCMGAMLAAVVVAQVADLCAAHPHRMARLKLLTLASPMANYALLDHDVHVGPALRQLAAVDIAWLDYTAPQDPLCCFLVDPMQAIGLPGAERRVRFRMRSARFDKMADAATMRRVRRDPLRLHFLYLLSTRKPVENDFFALTAGPRSLDSRLAGAAPAP